MGLGPPMLKNRFSSLDNPSPFFRESCLWGPASPSVCRLALCALVWAIISHRWHHSAQVAPCRPAHPLFSTCVCRCLCEGSVFKLKYKTFFRGQIRIPRVLPVAPIYFNFLLFFLQQKFFTIYCFEKCQNIGSLLGSQVKSKYILNPARLSPTEFIGFKEQFKFMIWFDDLVCGRNSLMKSW